MTSGWQGAACFRRYGRELVSKPAILLKEVMEGAIVVRLIYLLISSKFVPLLR